jgi:hypothetical protein
MELFSVKVKVLGVASAYGWVTIVILSMVKQAHLLFLIGYGPATIFG